MNLVRFTSFYNTPLDVNPDHVVYLSLHELDRSTGCVIHLVGESIEVSESLEDVNAMLTNGPRLHVARQLPPLSEEAQEARRPPPPEQLVDALQDRIHTEPERVLFSTPLRATHTGR